jgi:ABC-2 type transport system ATP-binding protein
MSAPGIAAAGLRKRYAVPFSEVSAHRATLEEAYLELTRHAVEFRAAPPAEVPR